MGFNTNMVLFLDPYVDPFKYPSSHLIQIFSAAAGGLGCGSLHIKTCFIPAIRLHKWRHPVLNIWGSFGGYVSDIRGK